jgi:hypothetical protein
MIPVKKERKSIKRWMLRRGVGRRLIEMETVIPVLEVVLGATLVGFATFEPLRVRRCVHCVCLYAAFASTPR